MRRALWALGPFADYLLGKGLKTLGLRMERHNKVAIKVARFLEGHPEVLWVSYPGLSSHPQHELAARQMSGYGGIMAFDVKGGEEGASIIMDSVDLCTPGVSLGGVETLICMPVTSSHKGVSKEQLERSGITGGTLRLSVGIEDAEDIIADLEAALRQVSEASDRKGFNPGCSYVEW